MYAIHQIFFVSNIQIPISITDDLPGQLQNLIRLFSGLGTWIRSKGNHRALRGVHGRSAKAVINTLISRLFECDMSFSEQDRHGDGEHRQIRKPCSARYLGQHTSMVT